MSLRDKNKGGLVVSESGNKLKETHKEVARPSGAGMAALQKLADKSHSTSCPKGNVGFVIDATGSRQSSWNEAQKIQATMFDTVSKTGRMSLRLVHFGGFSVRDNGWESNPAKLAETMRQVSCQAGSTQIVTALSKFLDDNQDQRAQSIILVGDAFEESLNDLTIVAKKLAEKKIKVFTFLEGADLGATTAFKELATLTGGTFAKFGDDMPLKDLCEGVALLSVGGEAALNKLKNANARTLLLSAPK